MELVQEKGLRRPAGGMKDDDTKYEERRINHENNVAGKIICRRLIL